jgi:protein ImuB
MTLAQARALCAHLQHQEHEPHRDAVALEALARWMMRFTPTVAIETKDEAHEIKEAKKARISSSFSLPPSSFSAPSSLFLDLTGCERFFGSIERIVRQVAESLKRFHIHFSLAVAPTPGAAWAAAWDGKHCIMDASGIAAALEDLPTLALRIHPEIARALHHLGIETVGQLMRLPRSKLPERFGPILLRRLDQALGHIPEPLTPLEHFSPIEARMDFDGAVDSLEAIWLVFKQLITTVVADLLRRGHGARELKVDFFRPYAVTLEKTIQLSRPSRDPKNLFNLMRCAMETVQTDVGFLGIRLIVTRSQRISEQQISLLAQEEFVAETELSHLIERLRIRLGEKVITQPALVESYVPEKSYAVELLEAPKRASHSLQLDNTVRPLHLLKSPQEIGVMVSPSHDSEGFPISFTWKHQHHPLLHTIGPERIAGQWWEGRHKTRDYFDVEAELGRRFWIFRVLETGKWFVQGEFE